MLFVVVLFAQPVVRTAASIPHTMLTTGSHVSNPDLRIRHNTAFLIDKVIDSITTTLPVQIRVVVIDSIGTQTAAALAQELLTLWNIAPSETDSALVLLFTRQQNQFAIAASTPLQNFFTENRSAQLHTARVLPYFEHERYDDGAMSGIVDVKRMLADPDQADDIKLVVLPPRYISRPETHTMGIVSFAVLTCVMVGLIIFLARRNKRKV